MDEFKPARDATSLSETTRARVKENNFGDGYKQVMPDGLRPWEREVKAEWQGLTRAQAEMMDQFFRSHVGQRFVWAVAGTKRVFLCRQHSLSYGVYFTVSVDLVEDLR